MTQGWLLASPRNLTNRGRGDERRYFSEAEALALVGKLVCTRPAWKTVRAGTTGRVTRAAESTSRRGWIIGITWDWLRQAESLQEWFDRGEYEY